MSFDEFINKIENLSLVERLAKRKNDLLGVELEEITWLPYQVLKHDIPDFIKQQKFEEAIFEVLRLKRQDLTLEAVRGCDNYEKLRFFFWLQDQYKALSELEQQYLNSPPDGKLSAAGIKELDILGDVNLIDMLAGGDILKWDQVRQLPYSMIFDKQLKTTIEARITKRLNRNAKHSG